VPGFAGLTLSQWISLGAIAVWLVYRFQTQPHSRKREIAADIATT